MHVTGLQMIHAQWPNIRTGTGAYPGFSKGGERGGKKQKDAILFVPSEMPNQEEFIISSWTVQEMLLNIIIISIIPLFFIAAAR